MVGISGGGVMKFDAEKLRVTLGRTGPAYPTHRTWMLVSISPDDLSLLREAAQYALKVLESEIVEAAEGIKKHWQDQEALIDALAKLEED